MVHYCIVSKISSCIPAHSRRLLVVARPGASADGNVVHSCSAAVHVCGFAKHQTVVSRAAAQQIRYCRRSRCAGKTRTAEEAGMLAYFFLQLSAVMSTEIFSIFMSRYRTRRNCGLNRFCLEEASRLSFSTWITWARLPSKYDLIHSEPS